MKIRFLFAMALVAMMSVSCGGSSDSKNKGAEEVSSEKEANAIIGYTNNVVDYLNSTGDWMRSNQDRISTMVEFMQTKRKPTVILPLMPNMNMNFKIKKGDLTKAPSIMTNEEQEFFETNLDTYKSTYTSMSKNAGELYKYIKNEDYKDDDYAKGKLLSDSITSKLTYLNNTKSMLYDKIDVVTEKAENIILQEHPLRDPINSMKGEMAAFDSLYNLFYQYSIGEAQPAQVDSAYQAVAADVEKNKESYQDILEANKVTSAYKSFYDQCESSLATYRKALRKVKENKKITDHDLKDFSSDRNYLIKRYNSFVN